MAAIQKKELERLEQQYGLSEDGLSYQHRCSRITAYMKGEGDSWTPPAKSSPAISSVSAVDNTKPVSGHLPKTHPLYGQRILITPMMRPDKNRALAYDEPLGPEIVVDEFNAGERIYEAEKEVQRMVGDYDIKYIDPTKQVVAKTTFPKLGTEISWCIGKELVPVVYGNDRQRGYIWSFPTSLIEVPTGRILDDGSMETSIVQLYGLKTLIRMTYPELEPKFNPKNGMMFYVDGVTLAASIPQTHALLKDHFRKEMMAEKAGFTNDGYGIL